MNEIILNIKRDENLEQSLLGAILLDNAQIDKIIDKMKETDFSNPDYRLIYKSTIDVWKSQGNVDVTTLAAHLKEQGKLEDVGGGYAITGLLDECPAPSNAPIYAEKLVEFSIHNNQIKMAHNASTGDEKAKAVLPLMMEAQRTKQYPMSDAGNAQLLADTNGDIIRYINGKKTWSIWNCFYWEIDEKNKVNELAKDIARQRQRNALTLTDSSDKKKEVNFGLRSEDYNKIKNCLASAQSLPSLSTAPTDWDKDPMLLQFKNGTLDLISGEFFVAKPSEMISQCTNIDYDSNAKAPLWEKSVLEMMGGKVELVKYIQRAAGYSLSGATTEHCFFMLYGTGANGKSVFLRIIARLMGDYYRNSRMNVFERKFGHQQSNDIARLYDARVITANESGEAKRLDEELLKEITGGDPVTARFLYQESFTFYPQFKIWFAVNTLPKVNAYDYGFWRRVRIIPFTVRFDGKNCDRELYNKLKAELSGIMNWAYEGFVQWQKIGLAPPEEVLQATEKYHQQEDVIAQFIGDCLSRTDSIENRLPAKDLFTAFSSWYDDNFSEKVMSQQAFGKRMADAGYKSEKIGGKRWYKGIIIVGH